MFRYLIILRNFQNLLINRNAKNIRLHIFVRIFFSFHKKHYHMDMFIIIILRNTLQKRNAQQKNVSDGRRKFAKRTAHSSQS